ncbi:glutamine synthetase family protein [Geminicoccus roseus]|uniref:glutamine synthetase family protein n=1 Tax=Geminicoccus roseus TaxID=404900 RepID=UPI00041B60B7|nr:glutamine synthetase family protein [Geminicoccus roseus]
MHPLVQTFFDEHPLVEHADLLLPDLVGIPRGKRIPKADLLSALEGGSIFTSSLYSLDTTGSNVDRSGLVWEEGDADRPLRLEPKTLRVVPWRHASCQVVGELTDHDGSPFPYSPRTVLAKVVERFAAFGLTPCAALEFEFYLVDKALNRDGFAMLPHLDRLGRPAREGEVWTHETLDDFDDFFERVEQWCDQQGLPYKGVVSEYSPGQFEVNLGHGTDMLQVADEGIMFKRLIKAAARASGHRATFMAKPFPEMAGSGFHVHVSLLDRDGRNVFSEVEGGEATMKRCIAGMQRLLGPSMLALAPNANSYRRFRLLSYAPTTGTWGWNNRTVAFRIPAGSAKARRIEHRVAGADANPYLVLASVLAGILDGLEKGGDPGRPVVGNAYEQIPASIPITWEDAIEAMENKSPLHDYFGAEFCRVYSTCRDVERERFVMRITPTEYEWYLSMV